MNSIMNLMLDLLTPTILLPLYRLLKGDRSSAYVTDVEEFNKLSSVLIRNRQLERIRAIASYAFNNTLFYKERFKRIGIASPGEITWKQFERIPFLTKEDIRDKKESLLSTDWRERDLFASATGGTTSSPVPFFLDWDSLYRRQAATIAFDKWFGYKPGLKRALLWGAQQDLPGETTLKQKVINHVVLRNLFLPSGLLDDDIMESYYRKLQEFSPVLLQAYPAPLEIFSRFLLERGYHLSIPGISCTAEVLMPHQSEIIEKALSVKPFNWYGTRDAGRVASECRLHQGMHINAYGLYIEVDSNDYVGPGFGSIVITDLWNKAMPLIRYKIGDLGRMSEEPCVCGCSLPRVMELVGRTADVFITSRGKQVPGVALSNRIVKDCSKISEMQIIQKGLREFEIMLVPGLYYTESAEDDIARRLDEFMGEENHVNVRIVESIPRERSGKVIFCKNAMVDNDKGGHS